MTEAEQGARPAHGDRVVDPNRSAATHQGRRSASRPAAGG